MSAPLIDSFMIRRMRRTIERAARHKDAPPTPGLLENGKLKLLFAGYTGANNMGADVRVEEMLRQFRHLFHPDCFDAAVFSFGKPRWNGYFQGATRLRPQVDFPRYLNSLVPKFDGVVACEGSIFKSHFTDLLPAMMIGALGLAAASGRLSVAYGSEAGRMSPELTHLVSDYCAEAYIIARNARSRDLLAERGLVADVGTDTAWTFEPHPREQGELELRRKGWNGRPILTVCPINPFWWPVNISLAKSLVRPFGLYRDSHYGRVFFHRCGPEVERRFESYLRSLSVAVAGFCARRNYFPVIAGCERLDRIAVNRLAKSLGGAATFVSFDYEPRRFVSILRCSRLLLSSRYHAVVTTMPAGVVSAGLSMDERLDNLLEERRHPHLLSRVDDSDLAEKLENSLETMHAQREQLQAETEFDVCRHLRRMSHMGKLIVEYVRSRYPQFENLTDRSSWENYLPPLDSGLRSLLDRYAAPEISSTAISVNPHPSELERVGTPTYAARQSDE